MLFEIEQESGDHRVQFAYSFTRACTPDHLRKSESEEMAKELEALIKTLDNPWQE